MVHERARSILGLCRFFEMFLLLFFYDSNSFLRILLCIFLNTLLVIYLHEPP